MICSHLRHWLLNRPAMAVNHFFSHSEQADQYLQQGLTARAIRHLNYTLQVAELLIETENLSDETVVQLMTNYSLLGQLSSLSLAQLRRVTSLLSLLASTSRNQAMRHRCSLALQQLLYQQYIQETRGEQGYGRHYPFNL